MPDNDVRQASGVKVTSLKLQKHGDKAFLLQTSLESKFQGTRKFKNTGDPETRKNKTQVLVAPNCDCALFHCVCCLECRPDVKLIDHNTSQDLKNRQFQGS